MHVSQDPWITGEIVLNIVNDALWIDPTETLWITIARSIMRYQKVQKHTFIMVFQCERKRITWLWKWKSHASIMRKTCKKREWQIEDRSIYMSLQCEHWSVASLASVDHREYDSSLYLFGDTQKYCCYWIEQIKKGTKQSNNRWKSCKCIPKQVYNVHHFSGTFLSWAWCILWNILKLIHSAESLWQKWCMRVFVLIWSCIHNRQYSMITWC
jgi:hypothetical protein